MDYTQFSTPKRVERFKKVLEKRQKDLTVVLENISDPHNLSACLRSCDAVGILEVCLVYDGSQEFPRLGESSSASARKWIEARKFTSVEECFNLLRTEGKKIYTTHMSSEAKSLHELDLTEPAALVFGNEHAGISDRALKLADANFLIPQVGMIQSLNISVACAVSVYEAFRQRNAKGMYNEPSLNPVEFDAKLNEWLSRK